MLLCKRITAALLCVMLATNGMIGCVQQPSDPGAGLNAAQSGQDEEGVLVFEAGSQEELLLKEYILARLLSLALLLKHEAKAVSAKEFDAEETRLKARWARVEKIADEIILKHASPVSSLRLWEQFHRLFGLREAWGADIKTSVENFAKKVKAGAQASKKSPTQAAKKQQTFLGADVGQVVAGGVIGGASVATVVVGGPAVVVVGGAAGVVYGGGLIYQGLRGDPGDKKMLQIMHAQNDACIEAAGVLYEVAGYLSLRENVKMLLTDSSKLDKALALFGVTMTANDLYNRMYPSQASPQTYSEYDRSKTPEQWEREAQEAVEHALKADKRAQEAEQHAERARQKLKAAEQGGQREEIRKAADQARRAAQEAKEAEQRAKEYIVTALQKLQAARQAGAPPQAGQEALVQQISLKTGAKEAKAAVKDAKAAVASAKAARARAETATNANTASAAAQQKLDALMAKYCVPPDRVWQKAQRETSSAVAAAVWSKLMEEHLAAGGPGPGPYGMTNKDWEAFNKKVDERMREIQAAQNEVNRASGAFRDAVDEELAAMEFLDRAQRNLISALEAELSAARAEEKNATPQTAQLEAELEAAKADLAASLLAMGKTKLLVSKATQQEVQKLEQEASLAAQKAAQAQQKADQLAAQLGQPTQQPTQQQTQQQTLQQTLQQTRNAATQQGIRTPSPSLPPSPPPVHAPRPPVRGHVH